MPPQARYAGPIRFLLLIPMVLGLVLAGLGHYQVGLPIGLIAAGAHVVLDQRFTNANRRAAFARLRTEAPGMSPEMRKVAIDEIGRFYGQWAPGMRDLSREILDLDSPGA